MQICGVLAVFFVPIAGFLVGRFELVPVVRGLYTFAFIFMSVKAILLYAYSRETKRGIERMAETKGVSIFVLLSGYRQVVGAIFRSGAMVRALLLQAIHNITLVIATTFFALYVTQNLGLPEAFLAYFPILRAVIMLIFLFFVQGKLNKFKPHAVMLWGIFAYLAANSVLLLAPAGNLIFVSVYVLVEACAVALNFPRLSALAANAIEPKERARIRGLFNAAILVMVSPFAFLAGVLSDMNRRLPFVLNIGLFAFMFLITYLDGKIKKAV